MRVLCVRVALYLRLLSLPLMRYPSAILRFDYSMLFAQLYFFRQEKDYVLRRRLFV